jgi:hypothetical protein
MKISTTHKRFADHLDDQTTLEYPERFLGPNWKDVLNFWIYLDTLSDGEHNLINEHYYNLNCIHVKEANKKATRRIIGYYCANAAWNTTHTVASAYATLDLISSHKLESLKFIPLFY